MRDDQREDVVCLAKATNPAEAHIWQQALEEEGIACRVVGDYLNAGLGDIPGLRAEVWVHQNDVERARSILETHQTQGEAEDEEEDLEA